MSEILNDLAAPFPIDAVSWRVASTTKDGQKGMAVCYIDSRDVQRRLDEVLGADWADEIVVQPSGLVTCRIGLLLNGEWRWRQDGTAAVRDFKADAKLSDKDEQQREMDQKGSISDAFKRAAVKWGIGRYLYDIDSPWVKINEYRGIDKSEFQRLRGVLEQHYQRWSKSGAKPASSAPAAPAQQSSAPREIDIPASDPTSSQEWKRLADVLKSDRLQSRADVLDFVKHDDNARYIDSLHESWKAVMRGIVNESLKRFPSPDEKKAA